MTQEYFSILTEAGIEWDAKNWAQIAVPKITHLAIGDGDRVPTGTETALQNQLELLEITNFVRAADGLSARFDAVANTEDHGGISIREFGVLTEDGDLLVIGRFGQPEPLPSVAVGGVKEVTIRVHVMLRRIEAINVTVESVQVTTRHNIEEHLPLWIRERLDAQLATQAKLYEAQAKSWISEFKEDNDALT